MSLPRHWLLQFLGFLFVGFLTWAVLNTPDDQPWNVALSALLIIALVLSAAYLVTQNFTGVLRTTPARFASVTACLAGFLLLLWILGRWEASPSFLSLNRWIVSAFSLTLKKPISPDRVRAGLTGFAGFAFTIRWIILPLLFIPLAVRAAGVRPVRYRRFVPFYLAAFLVGAVAPHYLMHWVPRLPGFRLQLASACVRFFVSYLLAVTAWVLLGRSVRAAVQP